MRAGLWRDTLRLAADFPLAGAGAGSFERLYPAYRTVPAPLAIAHAHNDHLELLAGAGAVGLGLFAWFVAAVLASVARACRRRRDPPALVLAFGALAGCVAFLVHGASDFAFAIGANAFTFFFLLGLAVSAAHTREHGVEPETLLGRRRLPAAVAHLAAAAAIAAGLFHAADLAAPPPGGRRARPRHGRSRRPAPTRGRGARSVLAARLQPLEAAYPARARAPRGARRRRWTRPCASRAARCACSRRRRRCSRSSATSSRRGARTRPPAGASPPPSPPTGPPRAPPRPSAPGCSPGETAPRAPPACGRRWIATRGGRPRSSALLVLAGFDDSEIAAAVPQRLEAQRRLARYLEATGAAH